MKSVLTLCSMIIVLHSFAQVAGESKSSFTKSFLPIWEVSTKNALDVALAMPEDLYGFKPNDSSMTFAEQMVHIANSTLGLAKRFVTGESGSGNNPTASDMRKSEVIELMKKNFAETTAIISSMTEVQANEIIKVFGGKEVPRYMAVMFVQDHLTNHRAKANLYIRINDIRPPRYAFF